MTTEVSLEQMTPRLGESFLVRYSDGTELGVELRVELVEVEPLGGSSAERKGFVLLFEGPETPALNQGMWQLDHGGEAFTLFLVPVGPQKSGRFGYEAIFN